MLPCRCCLSLGHKHLEQGRGWQERTRDDTWTRASALKGGVHMSEMIQMIKHMPLCVCEASGLGYGLVKVLAFRAVCARISRKEFLKHSVDIVCERIPLLALLYDVSMIFIHGQSLCRRRPCVRWT